MYFSDHNPPHFHAGMQAQFDIQALSVFGGKLPPRALGLAVEWASVHQDELLELWDLAQDQQPLSRIAPLP